MGNNKKHAWNYNPILRNCLVCNKEFTTIAAKVKVGKGKFCSKECYLKDHSKNTWSIGICKGCNEEFRYQTHRQQTCCSLGCNARWKRNKHGDSKRIKTQCQLCKKEMTVFKTKIKDNRGKFCTRKCWGMWMSKYRRGALVPNWKGGITPLYKAIRLSHSYKKWRLTILYRDKVCTQCGSLERLEVDHLKDFYKIIIENKIKSTLEAKNCEELWDINNGRVLCKKCHVKTPSYGWKSYKKIIQ